MSPRPTRVTQSSTPLSTATRVAVRPRTSQSWTPCPRTSPSSIPTRTRRAPPARCSRGSSRRGPPASAVVVQDTIPAATTFVTATPYPDMISGDVLTWLVGGVPAGGSGSITITVSVDAYTADQTLLVNSASLDYDDANGNFIETLSDSAETAVTAPVLTFSKTAAVREADPGGEITYTLTYP